MEKYYCDEHNHIGQVHVKDSEKELERINNQTYTKDEFKIIQCNVFIETSMFDNDKEIETSKNHVWIVKKQHDAKKKKNIKTKARYECKWRV